MKILRNIIIIIFALSVTLVASIQLAPYARLFLLSAGIIEEKILIAGTGSMYPTFPEGKGKTDILKSGEIVAWPKMRKYPAGFTIFGQKFFSYNITEGDIIEFANSKTRQMSLEKYGDEAGFVKRVVAIPGDEISLSDGFVYLNGKILDEPYIAKPRSTYGGETLSDCQKFIIPQNKVFVMGDNRKASADSRYELGLVDMKDIQYVLPWKEQNDYRRTWRDTSQDTSLSRTTTLDSNEFVRLLNDKRKDKNLKALKLITQLSNSSKIKGDAMLRFDDFSLEATKSNMTLEKSIKQSGYQNIIFAEMYARGYYEAGELLDNFAEFPQTKKILMSDQYQDIGIGAVLGEVNHCPVQVVVVHLGGYVPPNYTQKEIDSWKGLVDNLGKVLPSWQELKKADKIDQNKLSRLLEIIETRLSNAQKITTRMQSNQWLTDEEKNMAQNDKNLGEEAQTIVDALSQVK